ncbi:MAG: DUF2326 domain-containing protein [Patescibacteria group bacterium]
MITLKKLYFEPNNFTGKIIEPVIFDIGINFIVGDRSEKDKDTGEKMNSVGKSILIECIDHCMMKEVAGGRIEKIPITVLNDKVYICLDLEIDYVSLTKTITIKRNRDDSIPIIIIVDGQEKSFDMLSEAKKYIEYLFFLHTDLEVRPTLRGLLSLLIRKEDTTYNNILKPSSEQRNFSDLIKPHLYLFGFDISIIDDIKKFFIRKKNTESLLADIKKDFKNDGITPAKVKSHINNLRDEVEKLNLAIGNLEPGEGARQVSDELSKLISDQEKLLVEKTGKEYLVRKIKNLPKIEKISTDDIRITYNRFKNGLGDTVIKSINQVFEFKKQIDGFQKELMTSKLVSLQNEISQLNQEVEVLDKRIAKIYGYMGAKEKIVDLKNAIIIEQEKNKKLEKYSSKYEIFKDSSDDQKSIKEGIKEKVENIGIFLFKIGNELKQFEDDLLEMHYFIAKNKTCQFDFVVNYNKAEYLELNYRINLDGGASSNRIRAFIYDILLMTNQYTSQRHLGFVIHDNIFASTGKDDMINSLNYLSILEKRGKKFQYIVTINTDEFDSKVDEFNFDYTKKLTRFTRDEPFLKIPYSEI